MLERKGATGAGPSQRSKSSDEGGSEGLVLPMFPRRWLFQALHTYDYPLLAANPPWRTLIIVTLCLGGLAFSITGVVIGWRRLTQR